MRTRRLLTKVVRGALLPVAIVAVWQAAARHSVVVPSIPAVLDVLLHPLRDPATLDSAPLVTGLAVSVLRVLCGLTLAVLTAVPFGLFVGRSEMARDITSPLVSAVMVISPVAWMPIAILLFGLASPATTFFGDDAWRHGLLDQLRFAVVGVIWLASFFPILVNTADGARSVREAHIEAALVLGARPCQVLLKVILPASMPAVMTGLRVGGGIAWRAIIAAELFPGTRSGLGYMIATAHEQASYQYGFAAILVIAAIGLVLDGLLRLAAVPVTHWQPRQR